MSSRYSDQVAEATLEDATSPDDLTQLDEGQDAGAEGTTAAALATDERFTERELETIIQRKIDGLRTDMDRHYQGVNAQSDRVLKALQRENAELKSYLDLLIEQQVDPDRVKELKEQRRAADVTERELAVQQYGQALLQQDAARTQEAHNAKWAEVRDDLQEYATENSVNLLSLSDQLPAQLVAGPGDPDGFKAYKRTVRQLIREAADKAETPRTPARRPRLPMDNARGGGGGASVQDLLDLYGDTTANFVPTPEQRTLIQKALKDGLEPRVRANRR